MIPYPVKKQYNNPQMVKVDKLISELESIAISGNCNFSNNSSVYGRLQNADTILKKLKELRFLYEGALNLGYTGIITGGGPQRY